MDKVTYVARFPRSLEQVEGWLFTKLVYAYKCLELLLFSHTREFYQRIWPNAHENDVPLDYPRANCSSDRG